MSRTRCRRHTSSNSNIQTSGGHVVTSSDCDSFREHSFNPKELEHEETITLFLQLFYTRNGRGLDWKWEGLPGSGYSKPLLICIVLRSPLVLPFRRRSITQVTRRFGGTCFGRGLSAAGSSLTSVSGHVAPFLALSADTETEPCVRDRGV